VFQVSVIIVMCVFGYVQCLVNRTKKNTRSESFLKPGTILLIVRLQFPADIKLGSKLDMYS